MATAAVTQGSTAKQSTRGVERFAWITVGYNVLVILWGALVRATGSGAGCGNHWPLCNGQVIPLSPTMHTIVEFTHRCMTGGSLFIVLGLLVWTFRAAAKGTAARVLAVTSTILLLNEALLGALLVKLGYVTGNQSVGRMVLLSIHLSNTLLLLAALTLTARFLGTQQRWNGLMRARGLVWGIFGLIATLVVGVSGSMAALGDTLFPAANLQAAIAQDLSTSSPWLLRLRGVHPISAMLAALFIVWLLTKARQVQSGRLVTLVLSLLAAQFVLGILDVVLLAPLWMQVVHLLGADLYWVTLTCLTAAVVWPNTPEESNTVQIA
jgi:cytochrome c oxidase assembly protein subunit 15